MGYESDDNKRNSTELNEVLVALGLYIFNMNSDNQELFIHEDNILGKKKKKKGIN